MTKQPALDIPFGTKIWFESLFWYQTVKLVEIRSWKLGLFRYCLMLCILAYVIGWVILLNKGYQGTGPLVGSTTIKVKGNSYVCPGNVCPTNIEDAEVWDAYDVVYPAKEADALFLTTNMHITYNQTRGYCGGTASDEICFQGSCVKPEMASTTNGISTGNCTSANGTCIIKGWCPAEDDIPVENVLSTLPETFTVFMRTDVKFPTYNISLNNLNASLPSQINNTIFSVGQMLSFANITNYYNSCLVNGCIIVVLIEWNCNFDHDPSLCQPNFNYIQLNTTNPVSNGYNFRYTKNYYMATPPYNDTSIFPTQLTEFRDLVKVYGIRFLFIQSGVGARFDVIPLFTNIGSGLALLSVATLVSDLLLVYILPKRYYYKSVKIKPVANDQNEDEESPLLKAAE